MIFLHIFLAIQPVIAAYQHHGNSCIQCPDVVSFCPFRPPPPPSVYISSSNHQFHQLYHLFILLLIAGHINPNPGPSDCPKVTYANIRSIHNIYSAIAKFILDNDTDLFTMSETWIKSDTTSAKLFEITPPDCNLYQQPQEVRLGGGLGFFC